MHAFICTCIHLRCCVCLPNLVLSSAQYDARILASVMVGTPNSACRDTA